MTRYPGHTLETTLCQFYLLFIAFLSFWPRYMRLRLPVIVPLGKPDLVILVTKGGVGETLSPSQSRSATFLVLISSPEPPETIAKGGVVVCVVVRIIIGIVIGVIPSIIVGIIALILAISVAAPVATPVVVVVVAIAVVAITVILIDRARCGSGSSRSRGRWYTTQHHTWRLLCECPACDRHANQGLDSCEVLRCFAGTSVLVGLNGLAEVGLVLLDLVEHSV